MLRADVDQHVVGAHVLLGGIARRGHERDARHVPGGIHAGGRQGELEHALLRHQRSGAPGLRVSRSLTSAGREWYSSAMESSSIE